MFGAVILHTCILLRLPLYLGLKPITHIIRPFITFRAKSYYTQDLYYIQDHLLHLRPQQPFSLFICLDANKFVLRSFFSLMKRNYPRVSNKPLTNDAKGPSPVDVRRSTTLLLKLPNHYSLPQVCLVPFCALIFAIQGT